MTETKERKLILDDQEVLFEHLDENQKYLFNQIERHNQDEMTARVNLDQHMRLKESYAASLRLSMQNNEDKETSEEGDS